VPSGPPPLLSDYIDDEGTDKENSEGEEETAAAAVAKNRKIRFDDEEKEESGPKVDDIQKRMLQMAGQDVDQYMKEVGTGATF
jgi:hypothetical protein